jgi:hypothetical protein
MNAAEIVTAVQAIVEAAKAFPEVLEAIEGVFTTVRSGQDPSHAVKHLAIVAAARGLGLDPSKV